MEIMWAAGIYEGEGCCVQSGNHRGSYTVSVSQKDPELLYRLREMFGGRVKEYPNDRGTNVSKGRPITIYAWRVCGDRCRLFIASIYPYMTARRKAQIDSTMVREFLDFAGELPTITQASTVVHQALTEILAQYVEAHREFAKEKRRLYLQRYDQQEGPKERRRTYMRELRRNKTKSTVDTNRGNPNVLKFG